MADKNGAIAIIMARGGSKRVPRKNVRSFLGRPMIAWPVAHALACDLFSHVIVSTDDNEIADAATAAGGEVHCLRPASLSDDFAGTPEVLAYELQMFKSREGYLPEACCCLYGTSALALPASLATGYENFGIMGCELVMAVSSYAHPIERSLCMSEQGELYYRYPEFVEKRTQDLPISFHDIGLFYWVSPKAFLRNGGNDFTSLTKRGVVVSRFAALDIDTEEDWLNAEKLGGMLLGEE